MRYTQIEGCWKHSMYLSYYQDNCIRALTTHPICTDLRSRRRASPRRHDRRRSSQPVRVCLPPRFDGAARLQHEHGVDEVADVVKVEGDLQSSNN